MKVGNIDIKGKVVLAPLAGYTNTIYRFLMKQAGASLVYSEMISAKGLLYNNEKTWELTKIDQREKPISIQLFGGETEDLVKAAQLIEKKTNCDIIDLNMGCPVKKVMKARSGAYLLQDVAKVGEIVHEVVRAVKKPVSVKIRAGWDHQHINCQEIAKACELAGASLIAIHGRTKSDLYHGQVNLDYIKKVKESVNIPVIGNGDIRSLEDAKKMIAYTKVDAIMIGRGSFGNPWLITEINSYFQNKPYSPPTKEDKINMLLTHLEKLIELKGEKRAILEMRSLASWYVKGIDNSKEFRQKLRDVQSYQEFKSLIDILR